MENSCLYECTVMHHRLEPKDNKFSYKLFMFYLDLDELDIIAEKILFISRNRFNIFNFRDKDHLQITDSRMIKEQILSYVKLHGVDLSLIKNIKLITNLCTLGYQFNPVSFYFCIGENNTPICSVVEVNNTYLEMKTYFLGADSLKETNFTSRVKKNFYVSPFIDMDSDFHFNINVPDEDLKISINDHKMERKFFLTTLTGKKKSLNNWNVLKYAIRFPFITLQVITLIHWQAFKLWMKGISYHKKNSFIELQTDVLKPHKSLIK